MKSPLFSIIPAIALAALSHAGTVAHWQFNDLNDSSGNGHHLTNNNTVASLGGGRLNFSSTTATGLVSTPDSAAWDDTSFTLEAIVSVSSTTSLTSIVTHMTNGTDGRQWFFGTSETGVPIVIINPSSGTEARITSTFTGLTAGTNYYLGLSLNLGAASAADRVTFYLRDLSVPDSPFQISPGSTNFTGFAASSAVLAIGSTGHSSSRLNGSIDEIRFSDTNLALNELLVAVPEPSLAALSAIGLASLGLRRRRA
ncbi:PEP-CTERM sorting domain-containing protein [Luteolibacter sp. SL250]|uniref:PEP-CTERM sorting domain-containing protein n=1 Tax=Luteolibacter sp. SL250 TaxID=2995170 RepID=UPI002270A639|nr:PEP-CTERM sorting domain-containing protein [Luteolibacter sp. SL250]WAC18476.1 PEP-CTERM sorting domain-containing protein [Luteolibacter sp. SL250]